MATRHDLRSPFFVSIEEKATGDIIKDYQFSSIEDARVKFEDAKSDPSTWAYLGEIGVFAASNDELKIDYMTFETNNIDWWREVSPLRNLNRRGFGRPWSHGNYTTIYQPIADYNWRL